MRFQGRWSVLVGAALLPALAVLAVAGDAGPLDATNLPPGFTAGPALTAPPERLPPLAARLGAEVVRVVNQPIDANGFPAKVNVVTAANEAGAARIHATVLAARGEDFVVRRGRDVFEVVTPSVVLARRVFAALGLAGGDAASWEVSLRLALVDEVDERRRNEVFNLFLRHARPAEAAGAEAALGEALKTWRFGTTLRLARSVPPDLALDWTFDPPPAETVAEGRLTRYVFAAAPTFLGVPYVDVKGTLRVTSRWMPAEREGDPGSVASTARWPTEAVRERGQAVTAGIQDDEARVLALLRFLSQHVPQGGAMGSRDPVAETLARGHGSCFDRTDVFVSLCRSLGIPARQLAGWVPALSAGHVWAEVHLSGRGWVPVDATTTWLGVSYDYLPFFGTDDGAMPFLHLAMPSIRRAP